MHINYNFMCALIRVKLTMNYNKCMLAEFYVIMRTKNKFNGIKNNFK